MGHARRETPGLVPALVRRNDHKPARPVIESECRYEGIRKYTAGDVRHVAYRALQAGCCGYTYGSHGLWYPTQNETDRKYDEWGPPMPWYRAYKRPGGAQMKHLRACYESLEWWRLAPLPDAVQAEPRLNEQRRILAQGLPVDKQGQARPAYLIYFPAGSDEAAATLRGLGDEAARYGRRTACPRRPDTPADTPIRRGLGLATAFVPPPPLRARIVVRRSNIWLLQNACCGLDSPLSRLGVHN
ncbi:MAG: apiosidase-like domain-containing protein [Planctomycetota bacterium]|jgi:hypothetical protein